MTSALKLLGQSEQSSMWSFLSKGKEQLMKIIAMYGFLWLLEFSVEL